MTNKTLPDPYPKTKCPGWLTARLRRSGRPKRRTLAERPLAAVLALLATLAGAGCTFAHVPAPADPERRPTTGDTLDFQFGAGRDCSLPPDLVLTSDPHNDGGTAVCDYVSKKLERYHRGFEETERCYFERWFSPYEPAILVITGTGLDHDCRMLVEVVL